MRKRVSDTKIYELHYIYPYNIWNFLFSSNPNVYPSTEELCKIDPIALKNLFETDNKFFSKRDQDIILAVFKEGRSYTSLAIDNHVSVERISQIVENVGTMLRSSKVLRTFKTITMEEGDKLVVRRIKEQNLGSDTSSIKLEAYRIYNAKLPSGIINSLARSGVNYLTEFIGRDKCDVLKIRGIGEKKGQELVDYLDTIGISIDNKTNRFYDKYEVI